MWDRLVSANSILDFHSYVLFSYNFPRAASNAIFDDIYIYNTTGTVFSVNDAGNEYVNMNLRNSEITNTNAYSEVDTCDVSYVCVCECYIHQKARFSETRQ